MGRKDRCKKSYFDDASRFADIFNGYFGGKVQLDAGKLMEADTVLTYAGSKKDMERVTDCCKKQLEDGSLLAVYNIENQLSVDYGMVPRVMLEESIAYDKQLKQIKRKNADEWKRSHKVDRPDIGEFLYKVKKTDRLRPVVTLLVYWGEESWDGAVSLHELLGFNEENEQDTERKASLGGLKQFVPDYRINVLNVNTWKDFSVFRTQLRNVFELYVRRNDKKAFAEYATSQACEDLDPETCDFITTLTGNQQLKKLQETKAGRKKSQEGNTMWKAIEELVADGYNNGRKEGYDDGCSDSWSEALNNLMSKMNWPVEKAMDVLGLPEDIRERYRAEP